jgi:hypothetical protein
MKEEMKEKTLERERQKNITKRHDAAAAVREMYNY